MLTITLVSILVSLLSAVFCFYYYDMNKFLDKELERLTSDRLHQEAKQRVEKQRVEESRKLEKSDKPVPCLNVDV